MQEILKLIIIQIVYKFLILIKLNTYGKNAKIYSRFVEYFVQF